jgi:long-chain-fatty-acid--[acyl-carrier-protein] ligase
MRNKKLSGWMLYPILWLIKFLLHLRYRIVIKGWEGLKTAEFKRGAGILFLPNHPAEIDPVILETVLWSRFRPRPLVVEHFYHLKGFKWFMDLVSAMPLPTMDAMANKWRGKKVEKQFNHVADELKSGSNFLIYPSGRLKLTGLEMIGGASFIHRLLQACPETNVVLVRTTGLWGSQFSRALTGSSPSFGQVVARCAKILLKNGIFFAPRRDVVIEFEMPPSDFPYHGTRLELNKALENWYNRYPEMGPERLKLVSFAFWKEEFPAVYVSNGVAQKIQERPVSMKVQQEVFAFLSSLSGKPADQMMRTMHLSHDLGLDSLDVVQIYVFLDERYGVTELLPGDLLTVEEVLQFASGYKKEREEGEKIPTSYRFNWPEESRPVPKMPSGQTIQEVFLRKADELKRHTACMDGISGPLSYDKLKLGALVLSAKMREMPGDRIGVMLPSSCGAYLTILSVLMAGKVPVMINWTAGVKALDHTADLTGLKVVITSEKFLDKLENGDLGKIEECFQFLEEIRETITLKDKLRGLFLGMKSPDSLLKKLGLSSIAPSDHAVILFTSGTEALPKGVPLTHDNLLSNQRYGLQAIAMRADDILYGVLPPFHSFGFSVTGILPLLAGLKVCFAPDPTDSHGMARDIGQWKPTLFCCAPSFIKALFHVASSEQLQSLRLIVSGAEKTPQDLFDFVKEHIPFGQLLEGYGITECSPMVTIDRVGEVHRGVGKPFPGVELMFIDQQTRLPVAKGQEGEVCVAGPGVFNGYLGSPREPFVTIGGKRWYASGDLGMLDESGALILSGRLKRFIKIGGEMVSLGGLEQELIRLAKEKNWGAGNEDGPLLAVSAREKEADKPLIILYTTFSISKEDVNAALKNCGYGRIVKIGQVCVLEQIPLTGTGKTHYRLLDEMNPS